MSRSLRRAWFFALGAAVALAACGEPDELPPPIPISPDASVAKPQPPAAPVQAVARLESLGGQVTLERGGTRAPAAPGDLFLKDAVETGPDGKAVVRFPGDRTVEIGADARLVLGSDKTGLVIEVPRGLVLSRVPADAAPAPAAGAAKAPQVTLSILTPFGLTRVGDEGSEVSVDVGKDAARVDVKVGSVEFVSRGGQATQVAAGDALDVTVGKVELTKREMVLEPIPVTVVLGGGKAELKQAGGKVWRPVGKGGAPLGEGDSVRAREGRPQLALAGSGTVLSLDRGAELTFGSSERKGGVEESHLDVVKGGLTLDLAASKKSRVVLGDVVLENDGGGQFGVARTRDGLEVSAVTGDVTLKRGDTAKKLAAGQVARLGKEGTPEVHESARAELALPARGNLKLYHPGLPTVALTWDGGPGDYRVQVATDPGFTHLLASGVVHQPQITVALPRRGSLYWRASRADSDAEVGRGSAHAEPEPAQKDLARLRNEVRDGAEKTTIFYQDKDKPPAVTLTWHAEENAAKYRVAVYRAESLARPVAERNAAQPSMPLEAGILSEGNYVWSVTPLNPAGEELRGGRMNKLELVYDNSVPNLVITSPRNGEPTGSGGRVHAAGVAPVGARLFINGRPVPLDAKSRFDTTVVAGGWPPMVVFRLSRPGSTDTYTVRTLKRGR